MPQVNFTIIVASKGRPSLMDTLGSLVPQMGPGDELIVDVNDDAPWGHAARNRMMVRARASSLLFMDDDDVYLPGALDVIRQEVAGQPDRLHIFRMEYQNGSTIWTEPKIVEGQISTQMLVAPGGHCGWWSDRYQGDFDFACSTIRLAGAPVWHEQVIARYGR